MPVSELPSGLCALFASSFGCRAWASVLCCFLAGALRSCLRDSFAVLVLEMFHVKHLFAALLPHSSVRPAFSLGMSSGHGVLCFPALSASISGAAHPRAASAADSQAIKFAPLLPRRFLSPHAQEVFHVKHLFEFAHVRVVSSLFAPALRGSFLWGRGIRTPCSLPAASVLLFSIWVLRVGRWGRGAVCAGMGVSCETSVPSLRNLLLIRSSLVTQFWYSSSSGGV